MERRVEKKRKTNETDIEVVVNLDSYEPSVIDTQIPFFDHMLAQISRHGHISLQISAKGDLEVDYHHTVEDVGIVLGQSFKEALGDGRGIQRYGSALTPMDETLSRVVIDLSGRPYLYTDLTFGASQVGLFPSELVEEFFRALAFQAEMTLHLELLHGKNTHHQIEALFKGFGRSLREAVRLTDSNQIPSTKGVL